MAYTTIRTSNGGAANVRASQSTSSTLVGTIAYGTSVNVVRRNDGWLNILYNNVPRFIADYVVASAPQELGEGLNNTDNNKAMCNGSGVNIRSGASTSYSSVGSLSYKQNVTIYDAFYNQSDTYYWYAINSNCTQWVRGDYLTPTLNGISGDGSSSGGTNTEFVVGHVLRINTNNTNLRKSVGGDRQCYVQAGTKFIIAGSTTSGSYTWAKVYWGGTHATYMYVRNDCCEDLGYAPTSKKDAVCELAASFAGHGYTDDDLDIPANEAMGGWCQRFACFLCKAANVSSNNYPSFDDSKCSEGVAFFTDLGRFRQRAGNFPNVGDWIYYSKGTETYQHVGVVTQANSSTGKVTTVEGNVSSTVLSYPNKALDEIHTDMTVYGFASPNYS